MAAPALNRAHQKDIRDKIKTTQLVNRLQAFALGEKAPNAADGEDEALEIDQARLKAIEILLRKSLPDLAAVTISGAGENGEHLHKVSADEAFARIASRLASVAPGAAGSTDSPE